MNAAIGYQSREADGHVVTPNRNSRKKTQIDQTTLNENKNGHPPYTALAITLTWMMATGKEDIWADP